MGDRANFGFKTDGHTLYLYGHWAGRDMMANLARALDKARPRWDDTPYAIRICVSQLIGEQWQQVTGWGLSIDEISDNNNDIPVVDFEHDLVVIDEGGGYYSVFHLDEFITKHLKEVA